jgi:3-isopropylmalate/(R)-2-methylmalate dehydratase large subunit
MADTIIDKIWDAHVVAQRPGHPAIFAIDKMLLHEVTSAQAFAELRQRGLSIRNPERIIATLDHSIPTSDNRSVIRDEQARKQVDTLRRNCQEFGIQLYDFDSQQQGIVHVMGPELGFTLPGETLVCGDSHTSTHGAFGTLAFGVGTSEVAHVMASGCILQHRPKTMKVHFVGEFRPGVSAKDAIMQLIATIGIGGAKGHIIEYVGDLVRGMSMEARMTLCNMSIECGARAGLIAPDETTFRYLQGKPFAPQGARWEAAVDNWKTLASDAGCTYDQEIVIDVAQLRPMVSWGINPEQAIMIGDKVPTLAELPQTHHTMAEQAYAYTKLTPGQPIEGQKIDWAFVGSCTNGRIEDLRAAAAVLRGRKIAQHVTMYVVPGSERVAMQARQEGLDDIFRTAGADFRMPGCSMCLAMNDDKVPEGARCISTSNRNFIGRQGPNSITHLASPQTVAASAIAGVIAAQEDI